MATSRRQDRTKCVILGAVLLGVAFGEVVAMVRWWPVVWKSAVFLLTACVLGGGTTVWITLPSNRVICQWRQPPDVAYDAFGPYSLAVLEGGREWSIVGWSRQHRIFIGRADEPPSHGYLCDFTFHTIEAEADQCVRKSSVEWKADGTTFMDETGRRLFIPKRLFIGGR